MNYSEIQRDKYCYYMVMTGDAIGKITMQKHKRDKDLSYFLPIKGENIYNYVLDYLAKTLNVDKYYSFYEDDVPFEDEMYCLLTDKIEVKYDSLSGLVEIKIKDDNLNEKKYDVLVIKMLFDFYESPARKISK